MSVSEYGVAFNVDGVRYPLSVEEAWALREHLPPSDEPLGGATASVTVRLRQVVEEADGMAPPSPAIDVFESEKGVIRLGLDRWLHAVTWHCFPERAGRLRDALFIEDLGTLAFRDVIFRFEDGHETYEENVLVTGDPFEHEGRVWIPQHWHRERENHGLGEAKTWLICREWPG